MVLRITIFIALMLFGSRFLNAQEVPLNLEGLEDTVPTAEPAVVPTVNQENTVPDVSVPPPSPKKQGAFWNLIYASGLIGYTIILLSLVAVALMIEYVLTIRQKILMPPGFADDVLKLLIQGQLASAVQKCQADSSALAQILHAGMKEYEFGWNAVEKAAEESAAEQASRLYRKIEYLNVIGNIAPMIGLLGTVVGMVIAFQQLAESEGYARAADLAGGIYLALVTTVEGLIVAIPCLAAYSFFGNRIAAVIAETTFVAEQVLQPVKKSFVRKKP